MKTYKPTIKHLLQEDLDCAHLFLDECKVPRTDPDGRRYSLMGRINIIQTNLLKCQSTLETVKLRTASNKEKNEGIFSLCDICLKETSLKPL